MRNPFRKGFEISLNRVHDTVVIREGGEKLTLTVNGDAMRMVAGLTAAQRKLKDMTTDREPSEQEMKEAAEYFAGVIFGKEQAEQLMHFYADDPGSVINVCGQYFKDRLADLIAKVQKKMKV